MPISIDRFEDDDADVEGPTNAEGFSSFCWNTTTRRLPGRRLQRKPVSRAIRSGQFSRGSNSVA